MARSSQHRKTIKHYHEPGDVHELTFSCYRRLPLLTNDAWRSMLAQFVDVAGEEQGFDLVAFVFMPEHLHLIVHPRLLPPNLPGYLAGIKERMSKAIKVELQDRRSPLLAKLTVHERPGKQAFRYWQEGPGYDRNLQTQDAVINAIDYVHANPVRRGLVKQNRQWPWSSARFYESHGTEYDPRAPRIQPLPPEFFQGYFGRKELPG